MSEYFVTYVTSFKAFPGVNSHVILKLLFLGKDNVAYGTSLPLFPCVGSLVGVAGAFVTEGHSTELTLVRLDSKVNSDMPFQITFLHKFFWAMRALVSRANMNKHMFVERVSSVKFFATMITLVLLLILVTHPVIIQT